MNSSRPSFLAVAGNIGAGKSSLTRLLAERLGWKPVFESVEDNPYLPDFYGDMKRWSFHLQMYFLANRFKHHRAIVESGQSVIQDRSIYEDAEIFARNLHEMGNMDQRDYDTYVSLFHVMMEFLKPPDLLIYLRASVGTLLRQIERRGRSFEKTIPREYLEKLQSHYERWITSYRRGPLLIVESDGMDFVNRTEDAERIVAEIIRTLEQHYP